jgi:hypothetical protein
MTTAELHMALCALQLQRRVGERSPQMWVTFAPLDRTGKLFSALINFQFGPSTRLDFQLDAAVDLESDWQERLDRAVLDATPPWWQ